MKIKNKNKFFVFLLVPLLAGFFAVEKCRADDSEYTSDYYKDLLITEIMYDPAGSNTGKQWIELYNNSDHNIALIEGTFGINNDTELELTADELRYKHCHGISENINIPIKKYVVITSYKVADFYSDYPHSANVDVYHSAISLPAKKSIIRLSNDGCKINTFFLEVPYKNTWGGDNNGKTLEKNNLDKNYDESDWRESYIEGGTPGAKSSEKPEPKTYPSGIYINELLPNPKGSDGENEYIEIYNSTKNDIDLHEWALKDKSTGKYILPKNSLIKASGFFFIYSKDFSFPVNNSDESIYLLSPDEKIVSEVSFSESAEEDMAYAFDGLSWRWTSKPTPGKENLFDNILSGKIKTDENIYAGMYANFEVDADKNVQKFIWDFGDGHKSYLETTRHKYEKTGTYQASLKITGNGEDKIYDFTVKVKKYQAPKIRIKSISPNPKGNDTNNEWIEIQNKSKKKINLKNWSIATGWENLYNHPIRKNFEIKAGKTKKLTRDICAFTLNNTKTKIELRDPAGKSVQKIKYDRSKNKLEEDEIYEKEDTNWEWSKTQANVKGNNPAENPPLPSENEEAPAPEEIIKPVSDEEILASLGKSSSDSYWRNKEINRVRLLGYNSKIKMPDSWGKESRVLGTKKIKEAGNFYAFTESREEKHWAVKLGETFWNKMNYGINMLFWKFI